MNHLSSQDVPNPDPEKIDPASPNRPEIPNPDPEKIDPASPNRPEIPCPEPDKINPIEPHEPENPFIDPCEEPFIPPEIQLPNLVIIPNIQFGASYPSASEPSTSKKSIELR